MLFLVLLVQSVSWSRLPRWPHLDVTAEARPNLVIDGSVLATWEVHVGATSAAAEESGAHAQFQNPTRASLLYHLPKKPVFALLLVPQL